MVSNWGVRNIMDASSRFYGAGLPCYLRTLTPAGNIQGEQILQLGFQVSASGANPTEDTQITPQPQVQEVSMHDIGLNAEQLSFGARHFYISHTWVSAQQQAKGYIEPGTGLPDYYRVFRDPTVVGLYYNSRLFKMVSIEHEELGGQSWIWHIVANAAEQPVTS